MRDSTDLRVQKNIESIEKAFITLINEKTFQQVTVQNITNLARINRSTFYSHYDDKFDLLDSLIAKVIEPFTDDR